ncbi:hypothetical protein Ndes2437B_g06135 [Nannochloris sp. 'desiccata']
MARFSAPLLVLMATVIATASGRTLLQEACSSVFDLVSSNPDLSTLNAVIEAAGLEDTLSDPELQATVFAPSNEAFERLTRDAGTTVEAILEAPADLLKELLEYHVIPGASIEAAQLKTGLRFNTLGGDPVLVESQKIKQDPKYDGCASLDIHLDTYIDEDPEPLICDIKACNALVHIVDYPLIPNNAQIRELLPEGKFKTQLSG